MKWRKYWRKGVKIYKENGRNEQDLDRQIMRKMRENQEMRNGQ